MADSRVQALYSGPLSSHPTLPVPCCSSSFERFVLPLGNVLKRLPDSCQMLGLERASLAVRFLHPEHLCVLERHVLSLLSMHVPYLGNGRERLMMPKGCCPSPRLVQKPLCASAYCGLSPLLYPNWCKTRFQSDVSKFWKRSRSSVTMARAGRVNQGTSPGHQVGKAQKEQLHAADLAAIPGHLYTTLAFPSER